MRIVEADSWGMRLREEQEDILQNLGGLPVHGKTLRFSRKKSKGIKPFINLPLFFYSMVKTLRYYWHPDCSGCEELKPAFKELAKLRGYRFKAINVKNCRTKICNNLEYVPTIFVNGRKIDLDDMDKLLSE